MRHQRHKRTLGLTKEHRKALLNNLVRSLIQHNRITTTLLRAKETSRLADKLITIAKKNDLNARRKLYSYLQSRELVKRLVEEVAPLFNERAGGYTRIIKYKNRKGDGALLAILEFTAITEAKKKPSKAKKEKTGKTKKSKTEETSKATPSEKKTEKKEKTKDIEEAELEETDESSVEKKSKQAGFFTNLRGFLKK